MRTRYTCHASSSVSAVAIETDSTIANTMGVGSGACLACAASSCWIIIAPCGAQHIKVLASRLSIELCRQPCRMGTIAVRQSAARLF